MEEFKIGDIVRFKDGEQGKLVGIWISPEPTNYKVETAKGIRWTTKDRQNEDPTYEKLELVDRPPV